jgi:murein DD-endopeptidase MepM/ murein hydrolase activator NlpD
MSISPPSNHQPGNFLKVLILLALFIPITTVVAQEDQPDTAVYTVQEGDTLWDIAYRFGVAVEDLQIANNLGDTDLLSPGTRLVIPDLNGFSGAVDTIPVPFGETLGSLSRRYQVPLDTLIQLNRLVTPVELFAGTTMILPEDRVGTSLMERAFMPPGLSILELAVLKNTNPWGLARINHSPRTWAGLPGDVLLIPTGGQTGPGALPEVIQSISLVPAPITQGSTVLVKVSARPGLAFSGSLAGQDLVFFPIEGGYVALQGIHAMTEPGFYPLTLEGKLPNDAPYFGSFFQFTQSIYVNDGGYPFDPPLTVPPETIDPAVTESEDAQWAALGELATPEKMWEGMFQSPVPAEFTGCWTSRFGNRRSYNGSPFNRFHSGLDFCGGVGTELYAPAPGKVVFSAPLTVRGIATVIDHGWGVYTAYDHQSETFVKQGDIVKSGQLIGRGGATGRVTGPHLHWEVWVGGVQVDPVEWLENHYP